MSASERTLFRLFPERTGLSDLYHGGYHFSGVFLSVRDPIEIHPSTEVRPGKKLYKVEERNDPFRCGGIEPGPVSYVIFRPEEVHGTSGIGEVFVPFPHGDSHISRHPSGLDSEEDPVLYIHPDRQSAIQTGCVYPNGLPREKPADR